MPLLEPVRKGSRIPNLTSPSGSGKPPAEGAVAFSTNLSGWVEAMHRSQPPINRPQVFDSVSVMRGGRGIQPPRRQERQGGEKRHGWIGHEQYGWARAHLLLSPDSQSSWRPWRLGGSSYGAGPCPMNCPLGFNSVSRMREGQGIQPPRRQGRQGERRMLWWDMT